MTLFAAKGRQGQLVIWRGGWADIDLLGHGAVITRNPTLCLPTRCALIGLSVRLSPSTDLPVQFGCCHETRLPATTIRGFPRTWCSWRATQRDRPGSSILNEYIIQYTEEGCSCRGLK